MEISRYSIYYYFGWINSNRVSLRDMFGSDRFKPVREHLDSTVSSRKNTVRSVILLSDSDAPVVLFQYVLYIVVRDATYAYP